MLRSRVLHMVQECLPQVAAHFQVALPQITLSLEQPKNPEHGDFALDVAFQLAKSVRKSPWDVAQVIEKACASYIAEHPDLKSLIASITTVRPGFINLTLTPDAWKSVAHHIKDHEANYGNSEFGKGEKVILEYVSANPTGPLTIAHGRQACLGDTLASVMKAAGYEVFKEYYLNDGGRQINLLGASTRARYLELLGIPTDLPEDGYRGAYIYDIAKMIIEEQGENFKTKSLEESLPFFSRFAIDTIMKGIRKDLADTGIQFDAYFSEQSLKGEPIDSALHVLKEKGYLYEQDGALWFKTTAFGDDKDRVLRKSDGTYTYLVPDIAYHRYKLERGFTRLVNFLGPDHHGYIARLKAAVAALGFNPEAITVLIVQLTTLFKNGEPFRMSTRAGDFITMRELLDEVGPDATRFFFLMRKINSHLDFDLDLAKEKSQDNPVFYLQYAHARIASLLKFSERSVDPRADMSVLDDEETLALLKKMHDFPYQVIKTAQALEPYHMVDYLKEVAALFHRFYAQHRVVTDNEPVTKARLLLCDCVRIVLRNGLTLMGVSHPDEM